MSIFDVSAEKPWGGLLHLAYEQATSPFEAIEKVADRIPGAAVARRRGEREGYLRDGSRALVAVEGGEDEVWVAEPKA